MASYLKQHRLPSTQIPYHVKYLPPELDPVSSRLAAEKLVDICFGLLKDVQM